MPAETARTMQAQADVLLNLGNAVDNQLPSKLFDYFAAGKPVLHLCVIENDPALPYLAPLSAGAGAAQKERRNDGSSRHAATLAD